MSLRIPPSHQNMLLSEITGNVKMIKMSARCDSCSLGKNNRMKLHGEKKNQSYFLSTSSVLRIVVMLVVICIPTLFTSWHTEKMMKFFMTRWDRQLRLLSVQRSLPRSSSSSTYGPGILQIKGTNIRAHLFSGRDWDP